MKSRRDTEIFADGRKCILMLFAPVRFFNHSASIPFIILLLSLNSFPFACTASLYGFPSVHFRPPVHSPRRPGLCLSLLLAPPTSIAFRRSSFSFRLRAALLQIVFLRLPLSSCVVVRLPHSSRFTSLECRKTFIAIVMAFLRSLLPRCSPHPGQAQARTRYLNSHRLQPPPTQRRQ